MAEIHHKFVSAGETQLLFYLSILNRQNPLGPNPWHRLGGFFFGPMRASGSGA